MGTKSGLGMGPAQCIPGFRVFEGSAARSNAQTAMTELMRSLKPDDKEMMRRKRSAAWKSIKDPNGVYQYISKEISKLRIDS